MSIATKILQVLSFKERAQKNRKLGTFMGVYIPTILMLFGVIVFLRVGWVTGQAGLTSTLIMITFAALVSLLSILSMAAIATNIDIGRGGVYYIISRSLGIEVGCAIGLPLYIRQTLSIAFSVVGFSESLHDLIPSWPITTIGIWSLAALATLAYVSLKGALKIQLIIFIILIVSFLSLFTGTQLAPAQPGDFSLLPAKSMGFWALFAILFPAMTGVESSVALSGDLRKPSRSIPLGTITALLSAYLIYMALPIFLSYHIPMDRLASDPLVLRDIARVPHLIMLGIWGATLSSALGGLLGAPRTLQALAEDGVVPKFFGRTAGNSQNPKIAIVTTFLLSLISVYFGSVNVIAPLLSMICLICYGVVNLSVGIEALMANPSWRPRFRIHWSISIIAAILCLFTMLMIGVGAAMAALLLVSVIFLIAKRQQLHGSWDDLRIGILMYFARQAIYRLTYAKKVSKSWRPHFLVFSKGIQKDPNNLIRFSQAICQSKGFVTMTSFVPLSEASEDKKRKLGRLLSQNLRKQHIQAFVELKGSDNIASSMHNMIEHYGLGPIMPNTVVYGAIANEIGQLAFARTVIRAYQKHFNVILINDKNTESHPHKALNHLLGDIHIWWDDAMQDNTEFMLILGYMLQRNPAWRKARICVKAIASNEMMRDQKLEYFKNLSLKKRLPWNTEIFLHPLLPSDPFELAQKHSKDAGIIFLSLRPPREEETEEEYADFLQSLHDASHEYLPTAFVLSSEHTPLDKILI